MVDPDRDRDGFLDEVDKCPDEPGVAPGKGVEPGRITTRGAGPDEPIADNTNAKGRAKNRRIEFKIVLE